MTGVITLRDTVILPERNVPFDLSVEMSFGVTLSAGDFLHTKLWSRDTIAQVWIKIQRLDEGKITCSVSSALAGAELPAGTLMVVFSPGDGAARMERIEEFVNGEWRLVEGLIAGRWTTIVEGNSQETATE